MVWYMVSVDLYNAIVTKVSNAVSTKSNPTFNRTDTWPEN